MNKARRIGAFLAATVAACALSSLAAAPADAGSSAAAAATSSTAQRARGPQPIDQLLDSARIDQGKWEAVQWRTDRRVCHFKLTIWGGSKADIRYPDNTQYYSSFANGSTLSRGETDFTAFRVTPHYQGIIPLILVARYTYDDCGRHARTTVKTTGFVVPVTN
jgi:hypothetical protein